MMCRVPLVCAPCCFAAIVPSCLCALYALYAGHPYIHWISLKSFCCVAAEEYKHMLDQSPSTNPAHDHSHKYTNFMLCTGYMLMR